MSVWQQEEEDEEKWERGRRGGGGGNCRQTKSFCCLSAKWCLSDYSPSQPSPMSFVCLLLMLMLLFWLVTWRARKLIGKSIPSISDDDAVTSFHVRLKSTLELVVYFFPIPLFPFCLVSQSVFSVELWSRGWKKTVWFAEDTASPVFVELFCSTSRWKAVEMSVSSGKLLWWEKGEKKDYPKKVKVYFWN